MLLTTSSFPAGMLVEDILYGALTSGVNVRKRFFVLQYILSVLDRILCNVCPEHAACLQNTVSKWQQT